MFEETTIRGITFRPALFCAPLAGLTHHSLRRLLSEFGGCGAFYTEMLSARHILHEDIHRSPWLRRAPSEPRLIYQLMLREGDPLDRIIDRLSALAPDGLDLNLACHAPAVRQLDAGSRLFDNQPLLAGFLETARRCWPGLLTVKIRLGHDSPGWESCFIERMRLFEDCGVDAVVLHPRFFEDRFKRRARHELFPWAATLTRLPLIGNGDILGAATVASKPACFQPLHGLMVGRMAMAQPWIFTHWNGARPIDYAGVWLRLFDYLCADFPERKALARIKIFSSYYARNFHFGHRFHTTVQNAPTLAAARDIAIRFFSTAPATHTVSSVMGL